MLVGFRFFYKNDPLYPIRVAGSRARDFNAPAEYIIYSAIVFNLNALLPIVFSLKDSNNRYIKMIVLGVERQQELMGGIQKLSTNT